MKLSEWIESQPKHWVVLQALGALASIAYLDSQLPFEWTMFVFYTCPLLYVGWFGKRDHALATALICVMFWCFANYHSNPSTIHAFWWNALNRLVSYTLVAMAGATMRQYRNAMLERVRDLERTRELEEALVRVSEREQMRLGQDLHDGLCQQLAALDCAVACLRQDLEEKHVTEAKDAEFIQKQLSQALVEARNLARGIFPVQINEEGLLAALEELIKTLNRLRSCKVTLEVEGEVKIWDPQISMHLYRLAQEALNNTLKHSHATEASVRLHRRADRLVMTIEDNGIGFDLENTESGMGMQSMRYRAESVEGEFEIKPRPGGGTIVSCNLPLHESIAPLPELVETI